MNTSRGNGTRVRAVSVCGKEDATDAAAKTQLQRLAPSSDVTTGGEDDKRRHCERSGIFPYGVRWCDGTQ
jgi:hypothetical protein